MRIKMNAECLVCHLKRNVELAQRLGDDETATAFAKEMMKLYLSAPENVSSPYFAPGTEMLLQRFYGLGEDRYLAEKEASNRYVLERLDMIRQRVMTAQDPVLAGLKFAILGNYIDFSALRNEVSFEQLDDMLSSALDMELEEASYRAFCEDLRSGEKLLYITDNAGEIGFDRVLAEAIAQNYPHLQILFCVRGGPAVNDATRADAAAVGIPFAVMDNGTCLPGTELSCVSRETLEALENADVILSKGQGNAETLLGSGYNVYYAFLVKCSRFIQKFGKPKFTPMFLRERDDA